MNGMPVMPDELVRKAMHVLVNTWFRKWSSVRKMSDQDWERCTAELSRIDEQGDYQLVRDIGVALLSELERRRKEKNNG